MASFEPSDDYAIANVLAMQTVPTPGDWPKKQPDKPLPGGQLD